MAIDFSLSPELEELRKRIAAFIDVEVRPVEARIDAERLEETDHDAYVTAPLCGRGQMSGWGSAS
ncbi:MAG: hypothetical protein F4117_15170 [Acidimicrobiales bacterium]|nr:hypothetical protein [Acidimicrobiales bacterium]MXX43798.1 hypothetical protein [Acidimicrobiales bacterium]MXZ14248.1 hypothetical protein [Acidimicrobiales bacterium]MYB80656.1 hypothetical protein [Acidimicrobiales bacterium]MYD34456.1 hypothetical protein [Acidimicrobiales bacterium]